MELMWVRERSQDYLRVYILNSLVNGLSSQISVSTSAKTFSKLIEDAIHEADTIFKDNEQLRAEIEQLEDVIKLQENTIHLAKGMAEENANLHRACQILVEENLKMKGDAQIFRDRMQSYEDEIKRLNEQHHGQFYRQIPGYCS